MSTKYIAKIQVVDPSDQGRKSVEAAVLLANDLVIDSKESSEAAQIALRRVAGAKKEIKGLFAEPRKTTHAAHKAVTTAENSLVHPLDEARKIIIRKLNDWDDAREKIEAELARVAEIKAKEEAERRQLDEAAHAEAMGDTEEAEVILNEEPDVPPVVVESQRVKVTGVTTTTGYGAEVVNMMKFLSWVINNPMYLRLVKPDEVELRKVATALKDDLAIPGVRVIKKVSRSVRA